MVSRRVHCLHSHKENPVKLKNDIPVPDALVVPGRPPEYPFRTMAIGQSFSIPLDKLRAVRSAVWRQNRHGLRRFIVGKHKGLWHCWRTE